MKRYVPILILVVCNMCFTMAQTITCIDSELPSNWNSIGPFEFENGNVMGRAAAISPDKSNLDNIIIGTRASGLWRTNDGGSTWSNITGYDIPALGVEGIVRYEDTYDILYAVTNFTGSDLNIYNAGLIYSDNGGNNWNEVESYPMEYQRNGDWFITKIFLEDGSDNVWLGNNKKLFCRNVSGFWESRPSYVGEYVFADLDDFTTDNNHRIGEVDQVPGNEEFIVVSPSQGSNLDYIYSKNGGENWYSFNIPHFPTVPSGGYYEMTVLTSIPTSGKAYAIFLFNIYNSSSERVGYDNYLTHYDITLPIPYAGSTYSISTDLLSSGVISYFEVLPGDGSITNDQCFIGRSQNTMYRASIPFSSASFSFSSISNYTGFGFNCHTDIRDVKTIYDASTDKYICFIAHDGGVSLAVDLLNTNSDSDWDNINGEGLTITEFVGFGNSELQKERILATAVDGNSKRRMISSTPPIEPTFYQGPGGDNYDCAVSSIEADRGVYITNG